MVAARLMSWRLLHSLAPSPGTRLQRNVGPPPPRSPFAPFAGRGGATVVATDATREQHEEQSAVDGSPSAVPTVGSSDAGEPSVAVSNRAVELTAVDGSLLRHQRSLHPPPYPSTSTPHQPSAPARSRWQPSHSIVLDATVRRFRRGDHDNGAHGGRGAGPQSAAAVFRADGGLSCALALVRGRALRNEQACC